MNAQTFFISAKRYYVKHATAAAGADLRMYVMEGLAAFEAYSITIEREGRTANWGVAATSVQDHTVRDGFLEDLATWGKYTMVVLFPDPDAAGLSRCKGILERLVHCRSSLLSKLRVVIPPLFVKVDETLGDEYYTIQAARGSMMRLNHTHHMVVGAATLYHVHRVRLMNNPIAFSGDWNVISADLSVFDRTLIGDRTPFAGFATLDPPGTISTRRIIRRVFIPAYLYAQENHTPDAVDGLIRPMRALVDYLLRQPRQKALIHVIASHLIANYGVLSRFSTLKESIVLDVDAGVQREIKMLELCQDGCPSGSQDYWIVRLTDDYQRFMLHPQPPMPPGYSFGADTYERRQYFFVLPMALCTNPGNTYVRQVPVRKLYVDIRKKLLDLEYVFPNLVGWGMYYMTLVDGSIREFENYPAYMDFFVLNTLEAMEILHGDRELARQDYLRQLDLCFN